MCCGLDGASELLSRLGLRFEEFTETLLDDILKKLNDDEEEAK